MREINPKHLERLPQSEEELGPFTDDEELAQQYAIGKLLLLLEGMKPSLAKMIEMMINSAYQRGFIYCAVVLRAKIEKDKASEASEASEEALKAATPESTTTH